jgi:hypothetical protein
MNLEPVNPRDRSDWDALLLKSGDQSFFHTSGWAAVLEKAYGFKPVYFVSSVEGRLIFLMPMMEVRSRLTGRRGVSLPFTDFCPPHVEGDAFPEDAVGRVIDYGLRAGWDYIEWRDGRCFDDSLPPYDTYFVHDLDLARPEAELFSLLKDANQRNIKKAVREGVSISIDQSLASVKAFYRLNCLTRKRHGLPPQPYSFFGHVFESIVARGGGIVISASHGGQPIAASVFFHFGAEALYKYGASDLVHQGVRPNNLIMWEAIKWYRDRGFKNLNLGRTEIDNEGLLKYKRTWGAKESLLRYYRYDVKKKAFLHRPPAGRLSTKIFSRTPVPVLRLFGRLFYKHAG